MGDAPIKLILRKPYLNILESTDFVEILTVLAACTMLLTRETGYYKERLATSP